MDTQQVRLDSLEDLLDIMAVGNPVLQRALDARRAALRMQQPPPEPTGDDASQDPTSSHCRDLP
ncbi:hypothetical protein Bca52824_000431 [Brassica carinata]|uniref:Uncharacterized protein n=1 Tax=Brassica carinata TaxID=52824 RepID=A0A8X7WFK5_BRACI|nr:hypothetical protein Bca52824_000431 [Brassica carinata]